MQTHWYFSFFVNSEANKDIDPYNTGHCSGFEHL